MTRPVCLALATLLALTTGCSGSTTPADPSKQPRPVPNTDVGRSRAERDAAIASGPRMETQQRTEEAVRETPP